MSQKTTPISSGYLAGYVAQSANAVAIGNNAGSFSQGAGSVAIGYQAGQHLQGVNSMAIGYQAGVTGQGSASFAMGYQAGFVSQGNNALAIGYQAGQTGQGAMAESIGYGAGQFAQGTGAIAIGYMAGNTGQGQQAQAIGHQAGASLQGTGAFAVGFQAGMSSQGAGALALGYMAGTTGQNANTTAVGYMAGAFGQNANAVALGYMAGTTGQGAGAYAIGTQAGNWNQGQNAIAMGFQAGMTGQGANAIAVGFQAGMTGQGANAVAIGYQAGATGQSANALAVGFQAGEFSQGLNSIAMGTNAGMTGQGANALAVGANAGAVTQGLGAIAFGASAGQFSQGANALAMGFQAGMTGQKANAVAIGFQAGQSMQGDNAFAMGNQAGMTGQGQNAVAIGNQAGQMSQGTGAFALGFQAGMTGQGGNAFAMGYQAGNFGQGVNAMAVGYQAGMTGQKSGALAVGYGAGLITQGSNAMAIGYGAGMYNQGDQGFAVGFQAGMTGQKSGALAVGYGAGLITQGTNAMAVGYGAGMYNQGDQGFAVGFQAGVTGQGANTLAMGYQAGALSQGTGAIAIGYQAGYSTQGTGAFALGYQAGAVSQGANAIAVGYQAGMTGQGQNASAIGYQAGQFYQGDNAVAIGVQAGMTGQSVNSVAIGYQAGMTGQQANSTAIGYQAGQNNQGSSSLALGPNAGRNNQGREAVAISSYAGLHNQGDESFAAGLSAGQRNQGKRAMALGVSAGQYYQGTGAFAAGYQAGYTGQNANAASIGYQAGYSTQGTGAFALGYQAGYTGQGLNAVALGYQAGYSTQGSFAVAVGNLAGVTGQNTNAVAIGNFAGQFGQGAGSVAIGFQAGVTGQKANTVAIGNSAGQFNQGANALAIGFQAGMTGQNDNAMALGNSAGQFGQGTGAFAIGFQAGVTGQRANAMAIGFQAGELNQAANAFAAGFQAGELNQGTGAFAAGFQAGQFTQGANALALGYQAGITGQGANTVAMGFQAGELNQGANAFAVGYQAGELRQGVNAFAAGFQAGQSVQGAGAVAIGFQAGYTGQGANSIAIGNQAGVTGITPNSIVLNASGAGFFATGPTGAFYVSPISTVKQSGMIKGNILVYGENNQIMKTPATIDQDGGFFYTNSIGLTGQSQLSSLVVSDGRIQTALTTFAAGNNAGMTGQNVNSVAVGMNAGQYNQSAGSIALGYQAGQTGITGTSSIIAITSGTNICMSKNGRYQLVASATLMLSKNEGASFNSILSVSGTPDSIAMSANGQYMLVSTIASPNNFIYLSTNFGETWDVINGKLTVLFTPATSVYSAITSSNPSVVGISGSTMIITSNLTSFQSNNNGEDWSISKQMVTQYFPLYYDTINIGSGSLSLTSVTTTEEPYAWSTYTSVGAKSAFFQNNILLNTPPTSYMYTPTSLGWTWDRNLTFTISCRFSTIEVSGTGSIIWGIGGAGQKNTFLVVYRNSQNGLSIKFFSASLQSGSISIGGDAATIISSKFYYAVVTLKSNVFTLYLDGIIIGKAFAPALNTPPINHLSIGASISTITPTVTMYTDAGGSSGLYGHINEFRIYEGVDIGLELTQNISTTTRLLNSVSNTYPIQMYTPGIYPSFFACINADTDTLNLTSTGNVTTDGILRFSGTNSYKFSSGGTKSASIVLPSSFTISCVLQFTSGIASSVPFALVNSNDSTKSIELFMNSGGTFHVATGSSPASSAPLFITGVTPPINTWYYIAMTVSSTGVNIYINGYLNGSFSGFNSQTSAIYGNTVNLVLGALNTSGSNPFNGNIDDLRIYNGVLSEAQISNIYTDMSYIRPLRYASFDLGNSNLLNGYFPSTSGVGSYGGDETTKVSGNFSLRVNSGGAIVSDINNFGFSVSFWLRFNTLQNREYSFPFLIEANSSQPNLSVCERFGKLYLRYYNGAAAWNIPPKTFENFRPSDGNGMPVATATWYHITVVNDYHSVFLYVNGALLGKIEIEEKMNWNRIYISRTIASENFDGWIDEYRFYQASLSSYQVRALYTNNEYNFKNTSYSLTASPSNKYQLYTNLSNKVYLSKDSGSTSTEIVLSSSNYTPPYSLCVSGIGRCMAFCTTKELYYSMNYGNNWTILKILTGDDIFKSVALSDDGLYLSALYSSGIYVYSFSGPKNIAIGYQAGQLYQGSNSIAIGNKAGNSYQPFNSIIINANDTELNAYTPNGCFIAPISSYTNSTSTSFNLLGYGSDNQIVKLDTSNLTLTDDNRNWVTMRGKNLNTGTPGFGVYPTAYFGDQSCSIGWNFMGKGGETTFMNNFTGNEAFNFIKRNGTDSHLDLATINVGSLAGSSSLQFVIGNASQARNSALAMYASNNTYMYFACQGSGARTILYALSPNSGSPIGVQLVDNTNGWSAASDERIKLNITPLPNSLSSLLQIKTINYNLLNDTSKRVASGLSVQNLQSIPLFQHLPIDIYQYIDNGKISFVDNGTDSIKSLIYNEMIPYIIKALQEHVQEQRSENADLKAQLASLKATVDALVTQKDLTQIASSTSNPTGSTGPSGSV